MKYLKKLNENVSSFEELDIEEVKNLLNILQDDGVPFECKLCYLNKDISKMSVGQWTSDIYKNVIPPVPDQSECKTPAIMIDISPEEIKVDPSIINHFDKLAQTFGSISEFINRLNDYYIIKFPIPGYKYSKNGKSFYRCLIVSKK